MTSYITPPRKVPHITKGDDAFRNKFRSWNIADLTYVDINEYLAEKDIVLVPMASTCLLYTSPSPRDGLLSRMPSSA